MRIFIISVIFCLLSLQGFAETLSGKIVDIADGDTATLLTANHQEIHIRLNCIDAPEKSQSYGQKSKKSLVGLIAGEYVRIEKHDVDCQNLDQYGYLFLF